MSTTLQKQKCPRNKNVQVGSRGQAWGEGGRPLGALSEQSAHLAQVKCGDSAWQVPPPCSGLMLCFWIVSGQRWCRCLCLSWSSVNEGSLSSRACCFLTGSQLSPHLENHLIVAYVLPRLGKSLFVMELQVLSRAESQRALPAGHCTLAVGPLRPGQHPSTLPLLKPPPTVGGGGGSQRPCL